MPEWEQRTGAGMGVKKGVRMVKITEVRMGVKKRSSLGRYQCGP